MKRVRRDSWSGWIGILFFVFALCFQGGAVDVYAQGSPRDLAPEKQAAAQELEAKCVAKMLNLSEEVTKQLVDAYQAARGSHQAAMEKLRSSQESDRAARFQKYQELAEAERGKLQAALAGFLKEDQVQKAMESLGTFSRQWDRFVDTLAGFELGEEKLYKALELVNTYVIDSSNVSREGSAEGDWAARREAMQAQKQKLDAALGSILSEEQLAQWTDATTWRRR